MYKPTTLHGFKSQNKPEARVKVVDKMGHKFDINTFIEFIHPIITFWD